MRKFAIYTARFAMLFTYLTWVAGLLATWLVIVPQYTAFLETETEETYPIIYALLAWLGITAIVVSVWVLVKGYQWIGKWEIEEEEVNE